MMEWQEYISRILADSASFDGISLSFGEAEEFAVPPIIKASVLMLDKMLEHQGQFNILVFPERIQSIFIFTLTKLLYNIIEGRQTYKYGSKDPGRNYLNTFDPQFIWNAHL